MKTIKFFLFIMAIAVIPTASAQFANTNSSATTTSGSSGSSLDDSWNSIYISYDMVKFVSGYDNDYDLDFDGGFTFGWDKTQSISSDMPLYINYGGNIMYAYWSDSEDDYKLKVNYSALSIPINITYCFEVKDGIQILPYAGLNAKVGLVFNNVETYDGDSETYSYYDEDDMGDYKFSRFQFGCQFGVNAIFNKFIVGIKYQTDFTEVSEDFEYKFSGTSISVGYKF